MGHFCHGSHQSGVRVVDGGEEGHHQGRRHWSWCWGLVLGCHASHQVAEGEFCFLFFLHEVRDDLVRRTEEFLVILVPLPLDSPLVLVERLGGVETAGGGHADCVHSEGRDWTETGRAGWPVFIPGLDRPGHHRATGGH